MIKSAPRLLFQDKSWCFFIGRVIKNYLRKIALWNSKEILVGPDQAASAFRDVQLQRLVPRGHKLNRPKRQRASFQSIHLMLVGPDQAASAFRDVQLQGLEARGHKPNMPKRQKTPFRVTRLMLVTPERAASAFRLDISLFLLFI